MENFGQKVVDGLVKFGIKAGLVTLTIVIGIFVVKLVAVIVRKILAKTDVDKAAGNFIVSLVKALLWLFIGFLAGYFIGISVTALIAMVSAATVAIGLALQGSLSNLASGIVLAVTKPFKEGDFVEIDAVSGKIVDIKLFTTNLATIDNKRIVIPNSTMSSSNIINYTTQDKRMINMPVSVAYNSDIDKVRNVLIDIIASNPLVLLDTAPMAEVVEYKESGVDFTVRAWTKTQDYWTVYWWLRQRILEEFRLQNIEIPYTKMDLYIKNN